MNELGRRLLPPITAPTDPESARLATDAEIAAALDQLAADPLNADRLNNAAVALFAFEIRDVSNSDPNEGCASPHRSWRRFYDDAVRLLTAVEGVFPLHRAVTLNLAFMSSLRSEHWSTAENVLQEPPPTLAQVGQYLSSAPGDVTARFFLGSIQARNRDDPDRLATATATLSPLLLNPSTVTLGHAAVGDALVLASLSQRGDAPFTARDLALRALSEYDAALIATTDPGVYAGRAVALGLLGATLDAIVAQRHAVEESGRSIPLHVGLALLAEKANDAALMRVHGSEALSLALSQQSPRLSQVRFRAHYRPTDFLAISLGSDQPSVEYLLRICGAGGGYTVTLDFFPPPPPPILDPRRDASGPFRALRLAIEASVLLGEPEAVAEYIQSWEQKAPAALRDSLEFTDADKYGYLEAAAYVAGNHDAASWTVVDVLQRSGRYAEAAEACESGENLHCEAENAYRSNDFERAAAGYNRIFDDVRSMDDERSPGIEMPSPSKVNALLAGAASQAAGDEKRARQLFSLVARAPEDLPGDSLYQAIAMTKLGDLDLDEGKAASAESRYDQAWVFLETPTSTQSLGQLRDARFSGAAVRQQLLNNRGVARLWRSQDNQDVPPSCFDTDRQRCLDAAEDFAAALRLDPRNPVYLLNMGWASRLLGETDAANGFLVDAVQADPSLFPAHNDIGVLAARDGDTQTARAHFEAALTVNPSYDLSLWNLGILELTEASGGLGRSQAYLARAVNLNQSLREYEPVFLTDERIYRVVVAHRGDPGWNFARAASLAAASFASVTLLTAVWLTVRSLLGDKAALRLASLTERALLRIGSLLGRAGPAILGPLGVISTLLRRPSASGTWRTFDLSPRLDRLKGPGLVQAVVGRLSGHRVSAGIQETWLPWLATLPILVGVTLWPIWRGDPGTRVALATMALFAVATAIFAHEIGHRAAARWARADLVPNIWRPGLILAPLLLPLSVSTGPYVGTRVENTTQERAWWVYLGGPLGNLIVAVAYYGAFLVEPMPLLRLLVQIQIAAIAYALLPFHPLDGYFLLLRSTRVVGAIGFGVTLAGILLVTGIL